MEYGYEKLTLKIVGERISRKLKESHTKWFYHLTNDFTTSLNFNRLSQDECLSAKALK